MVSELTKEFDRRLSSIFFLGGHVKIIDEDDELLAVGWSVHSESSLFALIIDEILSLVSGGLGRECHLQGLILLRHLVSGQLLDVHGLSCTCWAWSKYVLHVLDECLNDKLHSDRILSWHHDFIVGQLDVDLVFGNGAKPRDPFLVLLVPVPVIDSLVFWEVDVLGLHLVAEPLVEALSTHLGCGSAERPGEAQNVDLFDHTSQGVNVIWRNFLSLSLNVL